MAVQRHDLRRWEGARYRPVLFSRPGCDPCTRIREFLAARGMTPIELDIAADDRALRLLLTLVGRVCVPTVVFRHEIAIGDDPERLEDMLETPYEPLEDFCQDEELEADDSEDTDEDADTVEPISEPAFVVVGVVGAEAR